MNNQSTNRLCLAIYLTDWRFLYHFFNQSRSWWEHSYFCTDDTEAGAWKSPVIAFKLFLAKLFRLCLCVRYKIYTRIFFLSWWLRRSRALLLKAEPLVKLGFTPPSPISLLTACGPLKLISLDPARTRPTSSRIRYHFLINICIDPRSPCRITGEYSHWFEQIREDKGCQISLEASSQQDMTARCAGDFQPGLDLMSVNCGTDTAAGLRREASNEVKHCVDAVILAL